MSGRDMDDQVRALFDELGTDPPAAFRAGLRAELALAWDAGAPGEPLAPVVALAARDGSRRARPWPAVAAAAVVVALGAVALAARDRGSPDTVTAGPGTTMTAPEATTTSTAVPAPVEGIWPTAAADRSTDPDATARAFVATYLGLARPVSTAAAVGGLSATVEVAFLGDDGRPFAPMTTLSLARSHPGGTWTVEGASSPGIDPGYGLDHGAVLASPARIDGRANAFEGTVQIEIREDGMVAGQALGRGFATGSGDSDGSLGPFAADVAFDRPGRPFGAVLIFEDSAAGDGRLIQLAAVRVAFAAP